MDFESRPKLLIQTFDYTSELNSVKDDGVKRKNVVKADRQSYLYSRGFVSKAIVFITH